MRENTVKSCLISNRWIFLFPPKRSDHIALSSETEEKERNRGDVSMADLKNLLFITRHKIFLTSLFFLSLFLLSSSLLPVLSPSLIVSSFTSRLLTAANFFSSPSSTSSDTATASLCFPEKNPSQERVQQDRPRHQRTDFLRHIRRKLGLRRYRAGLLSRLLSFR